MYRVALTIFAPMLALVISVVAISPAKAAVEAYIFRGAGDFSFIAKPLTFSEGMDTLGEKFEEMGIKSTVYRWQAGDWAYRDIMRRKPEAVALAGHSMGALTAIALANRLKGKGVRVVYMGLIDIPGPAGICPSNVEVAENFYHAFPVYGRLAKGPSHQGIVRNNLIWGQIHVTMDNSKKVHNAMLTALADFRGGQSVMQAYADEENTDPNLADRVDTMLTASTGPVADKQPVIVAEPAPGAVAESAVVNSAVSTSNALMSGLTAEPAIHVAALPASAIPIPTPRPQRYDTKSGLQPIE